MGERCSFDRGHMWSMVINYEKIRKMLQKGYTGFLAHVMGCVEMKNPSSKDMLVIQDFLKCISRWVTKTNTQEGNRVQHGIDTEHNTNFESSYRITSTKQQELKKNSTNC